MTRRKIFIGLPLALALIGGALIAVQKAQALGAPATEPLVYTGYLEENNAAVTGARDVTLNVFNDPALATPAALVCTTNAPATAVTAGRFRISMDPSCASGVHANQTFGSRSPSARPSCRELTW